MSGGADLAARIAALLAQAGVMARAPRGAAAWPFEGTEPHDLAALYAASDGVELPDGTTILPRGELGAATAWLKQEKTLDWPEDLVVLGEREDLVIVLDLDVAGARAGGGVLEAPTDGLATFQRIARSPVGYVEMRLGLGGDPAPEVRARDAVARRDLPALVEALAAPMYPGSERQLAHAALTLGALHAARGDEDEAMAAFARAAAARAGAAPRGAAAAERAATWRAAAIAAREAGAAELASRCAASAGSGSR